MRTHTNNRDEAEYAATLKYDCATPEQYEGWKEAARYLSPGPSVWFCADCTPEYQAVMKEQHKCLRPYVKFRVSRSDGVEGFVPSRHTMARALGNSN